MIIKHPRMIIKQHGTIKNYRYVGDVSVPFFWRKEANIRIKIVLKFKPNRSYGSLGI